MKKLSLLVAFLMVFSIALISMNGCTKKQAPPKEEPASGQMEEAAPDTTAMMEEPAE